MSFNIADQVLNKEVIQQTIEDLRAALSELSKVKQEYDEEKLKRVVTENEYKDTISRYEESLHAKDECIMELESLY